MDQARGGCAVMRRLWQIALLSLCAGPAVQPATANPLNLNGAEIRTVFAGQTVIGNYADGLPVRETYAADGSITYWDPRGTATGNWSVINDLFCTFYGGLTGGCFRVERVSSNCYDFLIAADTEDEAKLPPGKVRYVARASIVGKPSTCPADLSA